MENICGGLCKASLRIKWQKKNELYLISSSRASAGALIGDTVS